MTGGGLQGVARSRATRAPQSRKYGVHRLGPKDLNPTELQRFP